VSKNSDTVSGDTPNVSIRILVKSSRSKDVCSEN